LQLTSESSGHISEDEATTFERQRLRGEQLQVVRHSMAEVKASERGTAGEEESALTLKKRVENLAL
jgi:hypothetical protein